ncbi:MAG TPA: NAD(P)/FAD-dependent oxidoreductase [Longimicrobiales bacterium]
MLPTTAVIVGAGPNGLAAALELARLGHRVIVYEAMDVPGGGTRSAELTLPGFLHDICAAVHPLAVASPFFRSLPLATHGLEWVHSPALLAHPFDDGTAAVLERSTRDTGQSLDRVDATAWARLMDPFVARWEALLSDVLSLPSRAPRHPLLFARFGLLALRSALGLARHAFRGERARALFAGIAGHSLLPLDTPPSAAIGLVLAIAGHAVGWPIARGGSQRIADALVSILRERGAELRLDSPVHSLDELPPATATLLDLSARDVLDLAGRRFPSHYRRQLASYRYGPGAFKIDWALSEPIPWKAPECARAATVHLGGSTAEIAASARNAWEGRPTERPFVLLAQPTLFDPTRAPAGKHIAWAYCHVPHASPIDMTRAIEDQVERFAPGFRDIILARSTMTALELEQHNPNLVGGEINGGAMTLHQIFARPALRLVPYATPLPGLYICSASTPPGGGVHGMCGYYAARVAAARIPGQ